MVDRPEHLEDLVAWAVLMVGFGAFTRAIGLMAVRLQAVVLGQVPGAIAKNLGPSPLKPSWQSRNVVILSVLSVGYLGVSLYTLSWLSGLALVLGTIAVVVYLARLLVALPTSVLLQRIIERDLRNRLRRAEERGDQLKANAAQWALDRLAGRPAAASLLDAQELVHRYAAILEHSKSVTVSEALLPAPKEQIKDALVALARHAKASGASPQVLEPLRVGYASLADFVSERETHAATTFDNLATVGAAELDDAKLRELARKIAASGANALDVRRHSTEEFARLTAEFDERVRE